MASVYPAFDVFLPSAEGFDGSHLSNNLDYLDQVAASAGLISLSSFIDARTMALEVLEEDQLPENCPSLRWYLAHEGLLTVQGLLLVYHQPSNAANDLELTLVAELRHLEMLLKEADAIGANFHLLIDI